MRQRPQVTLSIVSHGHGPMVAALVGDLLGCHEVARIIITKNIPEQTHYPEDERVIVRCNTEPKGYGANHNAALNGVDTPFVCILNPDIRIEGNPFPVLLSAFNNQSLALAAPKIVNTEGMSEDSARRFPTLFSLAAKAIRYDDGTHLDIGTQINPDWLAGMFLLIRSDAFIKIGGFDEKFYLYYEDVDFCWRLRKAGYNIVQNRSISAIHDARRESHRSLRFAKWHLSSMARYFIKTRRI